MQNTKNKNKYPSFGFTLMELLVVIALLGILAVIIYPAVAKRLDQSEEDSYKIQLDTIKRAAADWALKHVSVLPENNGEHLTILLSDLKREGLIDKKLTNPITKKMFPNDMQIVVTKKSNNYTYAVNEDSGTIIEDEIDLKTPTLILNGFQFEYVELGSTYKEKGVSGLDPNGNKIPQSNIVTTTTKNGKVVDEIVTNGFYEYIISYKTTYNGKTTEVKRTVKIRDTTPPDLIVPISTTISVSQTTYNLLEGVSATDEGGLKSYGIESGNVAFGIRGTYVVTYIATDNSGNVRRKRRTITIV